MTSVTSTPSRQRSRITAISIVAIPLALAAVVGAYIDWMWWIPYQGFALTLGAGLLVIVAGTVSLVGRGMVRRIGLVGLAVGVGLLLGQNLGPSREPLIATDGGSMTIRLDSPVRAEATGPAFCINVASETEFQVNGNAILTLTHGDRVVEGAYVDLGDRWEALGRGSRANGVLLEFWITDRRIPDTGGPIGVVMGATEQSTVESTFANEGGSIRFAGLAPREVDGMPRGAPVDLAGTVEWTCGDVWIEGTEEPDGS
jgi:hypothetical protein